MLFRSRSGSLPEDLPEAILIGTRHVRVRRLVVELGAVPLGPPDRQLLLRVGERFPGGRVVRPLLQKEDRPSRSWHSLGYEDQLRGIDQSGILGSVDEAGQIEIVSVRPARGLFDNRSQP